jgi:hypothetical protein
MKRPLLLAVTACAVAALPAAASAATPAKAGTVTLGLKAIPGVTVSAVAPATAKGRTITLPVTSLSVAKSGVVHVGGALRLRAHGRTLTLTQPVLTVGANGTRLTAQVAKKGTAILTIDGHARKLNATVQSVGLKAAPVRLTAVAAQAIRKALKLKALKAGALGTVTIDAKLPRTGGGGTTTTPGGTTTAPGGGTTTPAPGGGGSTPTGPVDLGGPAPLARPATAVDATSGAITWHVRDSFIQYINAGEGTAVSNGATADPPQVQPGSDAPLVYQFHFAFQSGWYDPVSNTTRLTYKGTVTFGFKAHGIKLIAQDPEVEITGSGSRAIFVTANLAEGDAPKRGTLETLDPTGTYANTPDGKAPSWTQVPGKIPPGAGDSVFAGYYSAGDPFGWITASATTA